MTTIYHIDPATGEPVGSSRARPDPKVEGRYLVPAHATTIAPPAADAGHAVMFDGSSWQQVVDRRGERYWLAGDILSIESPGEIPPEEARPVPPEAGDHEYIDWNGREWIAGDDYRGTHYWTPDGAQHTITELDQRPPSGALYEPPEPDPRRAALIRIDTRAGEVRTAFASNGAFVAAEYEQARSAAQQWDTAGRPADDVPDDVQSWADATGNTAAWAADDIMQTAAGWSSVLSAIRTVRLNAKEKIRRAPDDSDFDALAAPYLEQLAEIAARVPGSS